MGVKITLDKKAIAALWEAQKKAAVLTVEALHTDVASSQVMPNRGGDMSGKNTFTDEKEEADSFIASLVTDSPQARRLYFHPEYNFFQGKNLNAGGEWLEPWITGDKKDFVRDKYAEFLKKEAGV